MYSTCVYSKLCEFILPQILSDMKPSFKLWHLVKTKAKAFMNHFHFDLDLDHYNCWFFLENFDNFGHIWKFVYHLNNFKDNPGDFWPLRHWLKFWQLRTWTHDNLCWQLRMTLDSIRNSFKFKTLLVLRENISSDMLPLHQLCGFFQLAGTALDSKDYILLLPRIEWRAGLRWNLFKAQREVGGRARANIEKTRLTSCIFSFFSFVYMNILQKSPFW